MTPLETVMAFMRAMEKKDYDTGLQHVADDLVYINSPDTRVTGPEGVRTVLEPFFDPIVENDFIILRALAQDNQVVLERLDRHRIPQGWFELPVTGVFEVNDGKITYWREYFDLATITSAMQKMMGGAQ